MSVGSFLELYTALFGWLMYDRIWGVLTETGIAYIPFIGVLVKNFAEPYQSQETKDASTTSIKRMELDIVAMLTVVVLVASPFFDLTVSGQPPSGWPFWIRCLSYFINLNPNQVEFALSQRWRIAAWLIIIDLLLVQGMFADFLGSLVS